MLFVCAALAVLFSVANVRADYAVSLPSGSYISAVHGGFENDWIKEFNLFNSGDWVYNKEKDRPIFFNVWDARDVKREDTPLQGKLDFQPYHNSNKFQDKYDGYPTAEIQFRAVDDKRPEELLFSFDVVTPLSGQPYGVVGFEFTLTRDAETGHDLKVFLEYTLWEKVSDDNLNWSWQKTDERVKLELTSPFALGNDTIYFGVAAEYDTYIADIYVGYADADQNQAHFLLTMGDIYSDKPWKKDDPVTPEPATLLILGLGVVGAGFTARRRK